MGQSRRRVLENGGASGGGAHGIPPDRVSERVLPGLSQTRAVLYGALVVGVLDITDALVFFGLRGAPPIRIFQSIAP
jgi:hypothetical protein